MNREITIFLVTYIPDKKLLIDKINKFKNFFEIIIVDMSPDFFKIKKFINTYNKNLRIIEKPNRGQGYAHNIALDLITTKFALYIDLDTEIDLEQIKKLYRYATLIKKFSILVPNTNKKSKKKNIQVVDDCDAAIMFFNMQAISVQKKFDEKIFLYFEELDYFSRLNKYNQKVLLLPKLFISHMQGTSSNTKIIKNLYNLQQWHYLWSMFYVYKKNYSFFFSLKKIFPFVLKDFLKLFFYIFFFRLNRVSKRLHRLEGAICSIFGISSFKRPIINKLKLRN